MKKAAINVKKYKIHVFNAQYFFYKRIAIDWIFDPQKNGCMIHNNVNHA